MKLRLVYSIVTDNGYPAGPRLFKGGTLPCVDKWHYELSEKAQADEALAYLAEYMEKEERRLGKNKTQKKAEGSL